MKNYLLYPRIYRIWAGMKNRVTNDNNPDYPLYGGRGITLQKSWYIFDNFLSDMKGGYSDNLTIDRIDNNKGYNKKNCRWVSRTEQNRNQNRNIKFNGETAQEASIRLGGGENLVSQRVRRWNWNLEKAFTQLASNTGLHNKT